MKDVYILIYFPRHKCHPHCSLTIKMQLYTDGTFKTVVTVFHFVVELTTVIDIPATVECLLFHDH